MSPTANDGVFLGYHIQPGFAWKGESLVAKLEALDYHVENGSITVQRARRVELIAGGFAFPPPALKEAKSPSQIVFKTMLLLIHVHFHFNHHCERMDKLNRVKKQLTN